MRIMGLDYGSRTMGVAISDPLLLTAQAHEIIRRSRENHMRKTLARIEKLIVENDVGEIVLGYPLNMDDSAGDRARLSEQLADTLRRRTGLKVVLWDERLTTVEAHDVMDEVGVRADERDEYVDKIAAAIILQDYLNERARKAGPA